MATLFPFRSMMLIALMAMAIATWLPFDRGITMMTGASHGLHVLVVGGMALAGGLLARQGGLACAGSWRVGLVWAVAVAVYVLVIDVVLARSMLEPGIVVMEHQPLFARMVVFMARAFNENVIYRLFWFSALVAALRGVRGGRAVPLMAVLAAGFVVQTINIGGNVMIGAQMGGGHAASPIMMAYWLARYLAPGVLYAWLYWRHGFVTAEIASVTCHIFLQPPFGWLI